MLPWINALIITDLAANDQRALYVNAKVENLSHVNLVFGYWLTDTPAQM